MISEKKEEKKNDDEQNVVSCWRKGRRAVKNQGLFIQYKKKNIKNCICHSFMCRINISPVLLALRQMDKPASLSTEAET